MKKQILFLCVVIAVFLSACGSNAYEVEVDVTVLALELLEPDPLVRVEMRIEAVRDSVLGKSKSDLVVANRTLHTNFLSDQMTGVEVGAELVLRCRTNIWFWFKIDDNSCFIK